MMFQTKTARKPQPKAVKERPPVRVRHDPPTLEEAVFAAQGLTDDLAEQAEIAAALMNVALDEVRPLILKAASRKANGSRLIVSSRPGAQRTVVVERTRTARRLPSGSSLGRSNGRSAG